ncbi:MAG TPA: DUF362 domain-containing protein [Anaerolineales bacterium]|nr:DUF362 domain-containing protein [Anaerolineales bacterium]
MCNPRPAENLTRAAFLRLAAVYGAAGAASLMLQACSGAGELDTFAVPATLTSEPNLPESTNPIAPSPTHKEAIPPTELPTQAPAPANQYVEGTTRIAFVKTRDRAQGVRQAIEMLGITAWHGKQVFLKPNFNSSDPTPGSTHPEVLRTLIEQLHTMGADKIRLGDRSGMGDTRAVMQKLGVFELAEALNFETIVFDELAANDWISLDAPSSHWKNGFPFARACLEADAIVQTCCLKTHRYGGHFTLSLKNSVGLVAKYNLQDGYNYMNELHNSPHQRRMIAEINTAYQPELIILDGVEAFVNGGPDQGKKVDSEVILAGTDRVAIDAVGVALLRYFGTTKEVSRGKIFKQDQIERAVKLGLGIDSPEKIEFLTADSESETYATQIRAELSKG